MLAVRERRGEGHQDKLVGDIVERLGTGVSRSIPREQRIFASSLWDVMILTLIILAIRFVLRHFPLSVTFIETCRITTGVVYFRHCCAIRLLLACFTFYVIESLTSGAPQVLLSCSINLKSLGSCVSTCTLEDISCFLFFDGYRQRNLLSVSIFLWRMCFWRKFTASTQLGISCCSEEVMNCLFVEFQFEFSQRSARCYLGSPPITWLYNSLNIILYLLEVCLYFPQLVPFDCSASLLCSTSCFGVTVACSIRIQRFFANWFATFFQNIFYNWYCQVFLFLFSFFCFHFWSIPFSILILYLLKHDIATTSTFGDVMISVMS